MSRYIDEHRARFGVEPICRALGVSASAYYQRRSGERSARAVEDERLLGLIREVHAANYLRLWVSADVEGAQARREPAARCRVQRLMATNGIRARNGVGSRGGPPNPPGRGSASRGSRAARLLRRRRRIACGSADLTYLRCWEGLVFFSFVHDASAAWWSAGSWRPTCAPPWSWTRCGWRWDLASPVPTSADAPSDPGSQYTSRLHPGPG